MAMHVLPHKGAKQWKYFIKSLVRQACEPFTKEELKDIEAVVASVRSDKVKADLAAAKEAKKGARSACSAAHLPLKDRVEAAALSAPALVILHRATCGSSRSASERDAAAGGVIAALRTGRGCLRLPTFSTRALSLTVHGISGAHSLSAPAHSCARLHAVCKVVASKVMLTRRQPRRDQEEPQNGER